VDDIGFLKPAHAFTLYDGNGNEVGELSWDSGTLEFEGSAEESAKIFFDWLKHYVDMYIEQQLNEGNHGR
jgi:hypothetical protein